MASSELICLTENQFEKYDSFLSEFDRTLLFHSSCYLKLIAAETQSEFKILASVQDQKIIGTLTYFVKETPWGLIVNSNPYYGSNGGIVTKDLATIQILADAWMSISSTAASSTYITTPFFEKHDVDHFLKLSNQFIVTDRMTHINDLTPYTAEDIFSMYHSKTRNMVRKSLKYDVQVVEDSNDFDSLYKIHKANMDTIGGKAKSIHFFENIRKFFTPGKDYKVFYAIHENKKIAGLLLFYFNKTVEYFTPVVDVEYRDWQPLSLLIHNSFIDSIQNGYKFYNWGGSWKSQESLILFKSRWGGIETNYQYFTQINNPKLYKATRSDLEKYAEYFFVVPYDLLVKE